MISKNNYNDNDNDNNDEVVILLLQRFGKLFFSVLISSSSIYFLYIYISFEVVDYLFLFLYN